MLVLPHTGPTGCQEGSQRVRVYENCGSADASKSLSAVQWISFDGREMRIRVGATFVRGQMAYDGNRVVHQVGHGRFLRPHFRERQGGAGSLATGGPGEGGER
jgi:hypothetical protein